MLGLSVCGGRESPPPQALTQTPAKPCHRSRPRWGLNPRAARGWGAHLGARVGLCTGQGTFLPRPACVVRVANQLRGGGGYHRAVARPRGAPEVPRRAQRAQRASPEKPGACPAYRRRTGQGRACRLRSARKRRVGRAQQGDAGRHAGHGAGWWARKETRKGCKISKCPGLRRNTWQWHEPAGPKGDRNDAHASSEGRASNWDGPPSCPLTLRPHDGRQKPRPKPKPSARCWQVSGSAWGGKAGGGERFA